MDPDIKFSSYLKNVPGQIENQIDRYLNSKNDITKTNSFYHSELSGQVNNTNVANSKTEIINKINNSGKDKAPYEDNQYNSNDIQYYEREITLDEELKIKNSLANHFIFQDLNDDVLYIIKNFLYKLGM